MQFLPAERLILVIIATLAAIDITLISVKGIGIDVAAYAMVVGCGLFALSLGQFYRLVRPEPRIAASVTAAGLFILFSIVGSVFNYMFLPVAFPPIDDLLLSVDKALGYDWGRAVTLAATYPWAGTILFVVYASSLPQLLLVVFGLGFSGQQRVLHHFLLTGVIGSLFAVTFWIFFPTFGPSTQHSLPDWVRGAIPLAVDLNYGRELVRLTHEGPIFMTPRNVLGLIGFPSFHIVMACMSVWFVPRHRIAIAAVVVVNLLMLPAVLVQGGHHLVDIFGGIIAFAVAVTVAGRVLNLIDQPRISAGEPGRA